MSAQVTVLLEEAVLAHLDNFNGTLMTHFDDLFENGREVIMRIKVWDDWFEGAGFASVEPWRRS